jgi:hypothetical protein
MGCGNPGTQELKKTSELLSDCDYLVIEPAHQCTTNSAKGKAIGSSDEAAKKSHSVTNKVLT